MLLGLPVQLEVCIAIPLITYGSLQKWYHHRTTEGKVPTCSPIHISLVWSVSVFKCKLRYRRYCSPYGNKWPEWKKTHQPLLVLHCPVPDCSREVPHSGPVVCLWLLHKYTLAHENQPLKHITLPRTSRTHDGHKYGSLGRRARHKSVCASWDPSRWKYWKCSKCIFVWSFGELFLGVMYKHNINCRKNPIDKKN